MIKLIIADDEYFIRARLSKIISEKRQNIDIVSICEDGEDKSNAFVLQMLIYY